MIKNALRENWDYARRIFLKGGSQPNKRFIIFGRGRSGSTLLVNLLNSHQCIHCDGEILHDYVFFPEIHVDVCASRHQTKVYGCKLLSYQIRDVQKLFNPENFLFRLHKSGYKIIYLSRTNLLRHALSNISSRRFKKFHYYHDKDEHPPRKSFDVNVSDVMKWIKKSEHLQRYEYQLLKDIPYLSLFYEKDLLDSSVHQVTADSVFNLLNLPSVPVKTNTIRATPMILEEMIENYKELSEFLIENGYSHFL